MTDLAFDITVSGDCVTLIPRAPKAGLLGRLSGRGRPPSLDALPASERRLAYAIAELRRLAESDPGGLALHGNRIEIAHRLLAGLDRESAEALALPPLVDLTFETEVEGTLGSAGFRLRHAWTCDGRRVPTRRTGAILHTDHGDRRLPLALMEAIEIAEDFDAGKPLPEHWAALARFRQRLDPEADDIGGADEGQARVRMTAFLRELRIETTDAVSISPREAPGGLDFDPVPFSREAMRRAGVDEGEVAESDGVLEGVDLAQFQGDFRRRGATHAYRLGNGRYLVVDRGAAPALEVMADMQRAPAAERAAFVRNPRPAITARWEAAMRAAGDLEGLSDAAAEEAVDEAAGPSFVETREFSKRVVGIGRWQPPALPIAPGTPTTWMPEAIPPELAGRLEGADVDTLRDLKGRVGTAIKEGEAAVEIGGDTPLPATEGVKRDLERRIAECETDETPPSTEPDDDDGAADAVIDDDDNGKGPHVLQTQDNFEDLAWRPERPPRRERTPVPFPEAVRTEPMLHQRESFDWAVDAWSSGLPGILNADEQGLGKTLQTLSFLSWLQQTMKTGPLVGRRPILVVAPTSLLENWEAEVERHLGDGGLGTLHRLYGSALASVKKRGGGLDTDRGEARLDLRTVHEAIGDGRGHNHWLLTTYTTLRNHQIALGEVPFAVAVFDEIQAIKNPGSLGAAAARAVNADFRIGLTGTPLENRAVDLWAIMDQLASGALGSLKEFGKRYEPATEERMRDLNGRVFGAGDLPALGLRRLKSAVARDLPPKRRLLHPRIMPRRQADRYEEARTSLATGGKGAQLKMLHHIRSVSVHPDLGHGANDDDGFISASARLSATIEVLRHIHDRGERALVFIEDRRMQYRFAELARRLFDLDQVEIINGATPVKNRLAIVNRFQRHLEEDRGFDLLVLGPRAAGTGLTLTAATHVIHLSRWWNPAVEEQCNDRTHRIGQRHPVTIHVPLAIHPDYSSQSFDCLLQNLMQRKRGLATSVLWPSADTAEDIERLRDGLAGTAEARVDAPDLDPEALKAALAEVGPEWVLESLGESIHRVRDDFGTVSILIVTGQDSAIRRHRKEDDVAVVQLAGDVRSGAGESIDNLPTAAIPLGMGDLWPHYAVARQG